MTAPQSNKPITTFNKGYVKQRIEARQVSLRSKLKAAEERLADARNAQATREKAWLDNLEDQLESLAAWIGGSILVQGADHNKIGADVAARLDVLRNARPVMNYNVRSELDQLAREAKGWEREVDALDHAAAYFAESPVEEYSVTSLQKLGLLEVVKFALGTENKK